MKPPAISSKVEDFFRRDGMSETTISELRQGESFTITPSCLDGWITAARRDGYRIGKEESRKQLLAAIRSAAR